jgi:hypothetical protein
VIHQFGAAYGGAHTLLRSAAVASRRLKGSVSGRENHG